MKKIFSLGLLLATCSLANALEWREYNLFNVPAVWVTNSAVFGGITNLASTTVTTNSPAVRYQAFDGSVFTMTTTGGPIPPGGNLVSTFAPLPAITTVVPAYIGAVDVTNAPASYPQVSVYLEYQSSANASGNLTVILEPMYDTDDADASASIAYVVPNALTVVKTNFAIDLVAQGWLDYRGIRLRSVTTGDTDSNTKIIEAKVQSLY